MLVDQDRRLAEEDMEDCQEDKREERSLGFAHRAVAVDTEEAADMAARAYRREICSDFARPEQPTTLYLLVP